MEQKKLLLVAISVGLFFVIIIGTALVFLKPAANENSLAQPRVWGTGNFYPSGNYTEPQYIPFNTPNSSEPDYSDYSGSNSWLTEGEQTISITEESTSIDSFGQTYITIEPKPAAGVPGVQEKINVSAASPATTSPSRPAETLPAQTKAPAQTTPAQTSTPAQTTKAATPAAPSTSTTTRAPAPSRTRDNFWVQTGAFTAMARAENVKQTLSDKGITSIIENSDVGGVVYFRVRIGPYTSQNEADYWLELVKSISGFEESQIRKTQVTL